MEHLILGDRYHIQQQLGKKPGRQTLLARDITTQNLVIIKLLSFGSDFEWDALKLFEREAETLKTLSHPSIPRYLDYLELDTPKGKGFALVQTYIEAKSLEEHLKTGRTFSKAEVQEIAKALLEILIYLHDRIPPVIHRDIKPSNILLTNRSGHSVGQVYLVDFGSVQTLAASEGGTMTVVGTYGYMPPEQFGGRAVPASDLYSLGATLIYLVTGTHPADLPQIDLRIQFEKTVNLNQDLTHWLKWMTDPSLNRRLATAKDALKALEVSKPLKFEVIYPMVMGQPDGSKIRLSKDDNFLNIIIPSKGLNLARIGWLLLALGGNLILFYAMRQTLWNDGFQIGGILLFLVWPIWICVTLQILFSLFGILQLRLDRNDKIIRLTYFLFGFSYEEDNGEPKGPISKLLYNKRASKTSGKIKGAKTHGYVLNKAQLTIKTWKEEYKLLSEKNVTLQELDWLVCEIGDWLKLPISRE